MDKKSLRLGVSLINLFSVLSVSSVVTCLCFSSAASAQTLEQKLKPLIEAHKGKVCVSVKHLETGEAYSLKGAEAMPTASLIKLPVMVEAFFQRKADKVDFDKEITVTKQMMVPGSGVLTEHFKPGVKIKVGDAVRLMIAFSDNTATNVVIDEVGILNVNKRMDELGLKETKLHSKVFKRSTSSVNLERSEKYGLGSTTADDMVSLLKSIHDNKLIDKDHCEEMKAHLFKCDHKESFPRYLPASAKVAHKTGAVNNSRTDAGIVYAKETGPFALCVLTDENEDKTWTDWRNDKPNAGENLCAKIAKEAYDHFKAKKK